MLKAPTHLEPTPVTHQDAPFVVPKNRQNKTAPFLRAETPLSFHFPLTFHVFRTSFRHKTPLSLQ